jgi:glycosyltransferase involved in cell wall biosynthesis
MRPSLKDRANETPLISVIIPTFQAEGTLERALKSVTDQTYKDYEALIIDGGSRDETLEIAKHFGDQFSQVRCFSSPDRGVFDAMNKGIFNSRGRWLYFLGSDDHLYAHDTLEQVSRSLQDTTGVVYGNVFSTRWNGVYDGEFDGEKILDKNICHQAIFFHRSVFEALGPFNIKYRYAGDWEFNYRWMLSPVIEKRYTDQVIANYSDGGLSSQNRDLKFEQDRLLLYVRHGKQTLQSKTKSEIITKEMRRSIRELRPSLFFKSQLALLRSIASQCLQRSK